MRVKVLASFYGSQDGMKTEFFESGSEYEMTDYLISCAPPGSITTIHVIENKAIVTDGAPRNKLSMRRK